MKKRKTNAIRGTFAKPCPDTAGPKNTLNCSVFKRVPEYRSFNYIITNIGDFL